MDYIQINPDNVAPVPRRPRTNKVAAYLFYRQLVSGGGGIVTDDLVLRSNFNDMANLSLTSPSNGSAVFNGTTDYVSAGNVLNQGTANATYCFWAYVTADSTGPAAIAKSNGGALSAGYGFLAGVFVNGSVYYFTADTDGDGNGFYTTHAGLNRWQHIAIVVDKTQTNAKIYVNGSEGGITRTGSTDLNQIGNVTNSLNFVIAAESDLSNRFAGNLANVAVWNRALTSDEINSIMWKRYDNLTASEQSGLQAWYALDDITGTSVPDSTGNYNGTAY